MTRPGAARRVTKVPEIRSGDTVVVLSGKDAGKRGVVERVIRDRQGAKKTRTKYASNWERTSPLATVTVVVGGVNIAKRHTKPRQSSSQSDRAPRMQQGGILDIAQPLSIGKVMVVCQKCDRPTRIAHTQLENGKRIRVCGHCGEPLEVKSS